MNGDTSTDAQPTSASAVQGNEHDHQSLRPVEDSKTHQEDNSLLKDESGKSLTNGTHDNEAESEAETDIVSPVKKAEAAKQNAIAKQRRVQAMKQDEDAQDGDLDAPGSPDSHNARSAPRSSARMKPRKTTSDDSSSDSSSQDLSDMSDQDSSEDQHSRRPSTETHSSGNPRKRKHRTSSVSLSNKRPSIDASRRRKRGATEDRYVAEANDLPDSPQRRNRRRAASIHSAADGGEGHHPGNKKRRSFATGRENSKSTKKGWDEESMSSEATSYGHQETRRPQRGIGRSTSTPGRPLGREAKRHVNKYGYTRLAEACETADLDAVKEWRARDPEQLELAEFAGNKPLQIAAINGNAEVVKYLIAQGCQIDCENEERDTPLIDAAENGHAEVVDILLKAGVDPHRQNRKGQQALDVINDETDNVTEIRALLRAAIERWSSVDAKQRREEEEVERYRVGPSKELHFMARSYDNLLRLVTLNDRNSVREFLDARVPVDNAIIAAAAKTGDLYLVNMLLAEMPEKKRYQKAEKPMLNVLGSSHFDMVKTLTELDQFNPRWRNRQDKSWAAIAAEKAGPMWRQEVDLFSRLEKEAADGPKPRQSSSPVARRSDAPGKNRHSTESNVNGESDAVGSDADKIKQGKNGRRLVNRKDMRAASASRRDGASDETDSTDDSDDAGQPEPDLPEKRGPGRPRAKPATIKIEGHAEQDKQNARRRSSMSHKAAAQPSLSSVAEMSEPHSQGPVSMTVAEAPAVIKSPSPSLDGTDPSSTLPPNNEASRINEEQQHPEGLTQQEELDRQHAAEQEEAQRALKERLQMEEDARLANLEEQRLEEERKLAQLSKAKAHARQIILKALPASMAMQLDESSDFSYDELGAVDTVLRFVEPLQVVLGSDLSTKHATAGMPSHPLVLNFSIAPLLGKEKGLDVLLQDDFFPSEDWDVTLTVLEDEKRILLPLLRKSIFSYHEGFEDAVLGDDPGENFAEMLRRAAQLRKSASQAYRDLLSTPFTMRWLSLQRALDHIHPGLRGRDIAISHEWRSLLRHGLHTEAEKPTEGADFFDSVARYWQRPVMPDTCRYGRTFALETNQTVQVTSKYEA